MRCNKETCLTSGQAAAPTSLRRASSSRQPTRRAGMPALIEKGSVSARTTERADTTEPRATVTPWWMKAPAQSQHSSSIRIGSA